MADELEMLTASFDADLSKFDAKLDKLVSDFNASSLKVEARNASLIAKMNSQFGQLSFTKIAGAVGATAIIDQMVNSSKALADQTLNTAKAVGVNAETLQGLSLVARRANVDQDTLTTSLEFFSAQVGAAQLKQTPFGSAMKQLGVDIKNGPEVALMSLADNIGKLPIAQQDAVAKMALGRGGIVNLAWLTDGSKNIQAMIAGFKQMGLIVPVEQLEKVEQIFNAWGDIKTEALVGFMEGFSSFAGDVSSPAFQAAMQNFGQVVGDVAGFVVKMAPYIPQLIELYAAFNAAKGGAMIGGGLAGLAGPEAVPFGMAAGALAGGAAGFFGSRAALTPNANGATMPTPGAPPGGSANLSGVLDPNLAAKNAATIAALNKQLGQQIRDTATKAEDADVEMVKAQNDAMLEMAKGTAAYYDLNKQAIEQNAALDIKKTYDAETAAIDAILDRSQAQMAAINAEKMSETQKAAEIQKISLAAGQEETNTAAETASKIETINANKNKALIQNDWQYQQSLQNLIQLNDEIRSGLTDVGVAGLTSFKAMGQAASQFLLQLAQMIDKLYVMQPLMDSLLGPSGTSGGGLLGGFLTNIFGSDNGFAAINSQAGADIAALNFADGGYTGAGGKYQPAGIVHKGEFVFDQDSVDRIGVPTLMALQRGYAGGGFVGAPPAIARAAGISAPVIVQQFDLSGAVVTDELFAQVQRTADTSAQRAVATYDRHALPARVRVLTSDPRRGY